MGNPLAESYGLPRLLTAEPGPTPADRWAEHIARSVARAEARSVARFRLLQEVERILRLTLRTAEVAG